MFGGEVVVDEDWTSDKDVSDDGNQELAAPVGGSGVTLVRPDRLFKIISIKRVQLKIF